MATRMNYFRDIIDHEISSHMAVGMAVASIRARFSAWWWSNGAFLAAETTKNSLVLLYLLQNTFKSSNDIF